MPGIVLSKEDLAQIAAKFLCVVCNLLLRSPVQAECGHHFCKSCVDHMLASSEMECKCQKDGTIISKRTVFPDAFVNREIMSMVVSCLHKSFGCDWKGDVRKYEAHVADCIFEPVQCVYRACGKLMSKALLGEHLDKECVYRPVRCSYCNNEVTYSQMKEHEETACPKFVIPCPSCKIKELPRDEIAHHQNPLTGECPEVEAPCCFTPVGCPNKEIMKLDQRKEHEASTVPTHLSYVLGFCFQIRDQLGAAVSGLLPPGEGPGFFESLKQKVLELASVVHSTVAEVQETKEMVLKQGHRITELERTKGGTDEGSSQRIGAESQESRRRLNNTEAKVADNEVLIIELNRSLVDCKSTIDNLKRKLESIEDKNTRLERKMESVDHTLAIRNVALADLEEFVRQQQASSYNGTLMWKIPDYARKKKDAMSGKQASFYSPCFYTSHHGYKMCARIYLNGDGMGRGTHISLFFVVMRGEYDALLRWPFRQKVTFMLLDQDNVEHVIDAFRPDSNSASFQRPRREMNVASGCPLFCSLAELNKHAYVRDDTMFVKIIVDSHDL